MAGETYTPKEMLARLVGFDTVSARSNLELMRFVVDYPEGLGRRGHRWCRPTTAGRPTSMP